MIYPYDFLAQLHTQPQRVLYARAIALTKDERPVEQFEGRIVSGSISIDGTSAVRKTCQLSIAVPEISINDYYWGFKTKIKLAVGIENKIDNRFPKIIWFEQGIFVITQFSTSLSATAYTINISGQDKMCLLNGTVGGTLNSTVDFGQIEEELKISKIIRKRKMPIKDIIRDMIHQYGGEPFHNIVINDLDIKGLVLQEYRYDTPMYIWRKKNTNVYTNGTLNKEQKVKYNGTDYELQQLEAQGFKFDQLNDLVENYQPDIIQLEDSSEYLLAKIDFGETAGYTEQDLVYPDDLIANPGDSITSVLDKIKNFLGDYEYFYNTAGQFLFQKKNIAESNQIFSFLNSELITTFNNSPDLKNVRNDFTVWGEKNTNKAIHMRFAIDRKPLTYTTISVTDEELESYNQLYDTNLKGQDSTTYWSESDEDYSIIGNSMYLDLLGEYNPYALSLKLYDVEGQVEDNVLILDLNSISHTGYEICDWREIIYRMALDYNKYNHLDDFELRIAQANPELYPTGVTGYEQYYIDLLGFWREIYGPEFGTADKKFNWSKEYIEAPEKLNFYFDFLDTTGSLSQFSVPNIGARPKVTSDKDAKVIDYLQTPNIIFGAAAGTNTGYRYFNVPNMENMFSKSAKGKSVKDAINSLLYQHGYCSESITIACAPVYCLDPNTRISINEKDSGIFGDYLISRIQLPLAYNGTMNITATKVPPTDLLI